MNSVNNRKRTADYLEPQNLTLEKESDTQSHPTFRFRGVTKHKNTQRYQAQLWDPTWKVQGNTRNGKQVYLGGYDSAEKAARSYDIAALKFWGSTAKTNFHPTQYEEEIKQIEGMAKQEVVRHIRRTSTAFSRGASKYRGVTRLKGKWQVRIGRVDDNRDMYLGSFHTEEEAAAACDTASIKYRGRNAMTNFATSNYDVDKILSAESVHPTGKHSKRLKQTETSGTTRLPKSGLHKSNIVDPQMDATIPSMTSTVVLDQHLPESQDQRNSQLLFEQTVNRSDISFLRNQTMLSSSAGEIGENRLHDDFVYMVDRSTHAAYSVPRTVLVPIIHYQYGKAPQFFHMAIPNPLLQNHHVPTSLDDIAPAEIASQFQNV